MTWYLKANWVWHNVGAGSALVISGLYWGVIYEGRVNRVSVWQIKLN